MDLQITFRGSFGWSYSVQLEYRWWADKPMAASLTMFWRCRKVKNSLHYAREDPWGNRWLTKMIKLSSEWKGSYVWIYALCEKVHSRRLTESTSQFICDNLNPVTHFESTRNIWKSSCLMSSHDLNNLNSSIRFHIYKLLTIVGDARMRSLTRFRLLFEF